jgi:glucose/arabinose dehydrogenase
MTVQRRRALARTIVLVLVLGLVAGPPAGPADADTLPPGFSVQTVISGLVLPTNLEFAPDGRLFVAEKRGVIKVYDSPADTTASVFADLSAKVNQFWDRGLLGLALPPNFPDDPWVYALYTFDAPLGQNTPMNNDSCIAAGNGTCVVSARLVRLHAAGGAWTGTEQVLISDWCAQFPSHTIGDLGFGPDGALYVTGGDGASFTAPDYGQFGDPAGTPVNPCGDPPGGAMTPPSAEGGMLRSQDLRTSGDPTGLDGTLLRLDPATGAAMPDNPLISSSDPNNRRIIAYGMRNPFRFTFRPGTDEVWLGDVGWNTFEEINVINPAGPVENLGWPCYEGTGRHGAIDSINLSLCENLYTGAGQTPPRFTWRHSAGLFPGDTCAAGSQSAVSGVAFYPAAGGSYPAAYRGGLFMADYSRSCVWFMRAPTPTSAPDPSTVETFATGAASPVDLEIGPNGELYYVDIGGGTIRRYRYSSTNQPPIAALSAQPTNGAAPLTVDFDATGSTDPNGGALTYTWDFGDGQSATGPVTSHTYPAGVHTARLTVTDPLGASDTRTVVITSGNSAPTGVIETPFGDDTWATGDTVSFTGAGLDPDDGSLAASAMNWRLWVQHCGTPTTCHAHVVREWNGVAGGEFVAPDHDYPSYLELELRVTDSGGLWHSTRRRLDPRTVDLTFQTSPPGLTLTAAGVTAATPFTRRVIENSGVAVSAPSAQLAGTATYSYVSWSDGGARSHTFPAPDGDATYTASFSGRNVTNIARNRPATARSSCAAASGPAKAVNGTTNGGTSDRWCSVGPSTWLQVDLGSVRPIAGIVLRHAGAGGESAALNTRDYSVQVSGNGATWVTVVAEGGNTANVTGYAVSAYARYVRLRITAPSSNGNTTARIYEMEVLAIA